MFLGRLHFFGFDSPAVAAGFARCDIPDATRLHKDAERALSIARAVGEPGRAWARVCNCSTRP